MVLVDRRRFVFKVVGGLLLACLAYCLIAPNDYEASARIAMRASPAGELNLGEGSDGNSAAFASGQTQLENLANIFRSDRLAWIVIVTQRLDRAPGFAGRLARKFTSFRIDAPEPEENHDPDLISEPSDPAFWQRIRARQAAGASIAMHGYRHRCNRVASRHFSQGIDLIAVSAAKHAGRAIKRLEIGLATGSASARRGSLQIDA